MSAAILSALDGLGTCRLVLGGCIIGAIISYASLRGTR